MPFWTKLSGLTFAIWFSQTVKEVAFEGLDRLRRRNSRNLTGRSGGFECCCRSLTKRPFYLFFSGDRHRALRALDLAVRGQGDTFSAELKPRERKVIHVKITLEPAPPRPFCGRSRRCDLVIDTRSAAAVGLAGSGHRWNIIQSFHVPTAISPTAISPTRSRARLVIPLSRRIQLQSLRCR